jgi:hypothetical protein
MAAIKNLKKDIHNTLGDLIETCYVWEFSNEGAEASKSQEIIDEAISSFDTLMDKIHVKNVESKKAHFSSIKAELVTVTTRLVAKINAL